MIKLFQIQSDGIDAEIPFVISTFPDKTSQVWKVGLDSKIPQSTAFKILWLFEREDELLHIVQLGQLLKTETSQGVSLYAPYLPYARQDKEISNHSTWALKMLADVLGLAQFTQVSCFDQHSEKYFNSVKPFDFHKKVLNHDIVCFPDKGALQRYSHLRTTPHVYFEKVRNQLTGQIESLSLNLNSQDLVGKSVVIVDDLCDGGGTFIQGIEYLQKHKPQYVDLCVSHGLFSQGREVLLEKGFRKILTTNSLLNNQYDYPVW